MENLKRILALFRIKNVAFEMEIKCAVAVQNVCQFHEFACFIHHSQSDHLNGEKILIIRTYSGIKDVYPQGAIMFA